MKICMGGTGYVGLVTGACFADMGNEVICVDIDAVKIEGLKQGKIPIYEPGLTEMVTRNSNAGRLRFTTDLAEAVNESLFCFIAVGTPQGEDGGADLRAVLAVAASIGRVMNDYKLIVTKSTVPVGTAGKVTVAVREELEKRGVDCGFSVASNPEFLKEGAAIEDFMKPDRIVVGCDDARAEGLLRDLYSVFCRTSDRLLVMDVKSAEMTKYAANAMLATRISFMNEVAAICDQVGADIAHVRVGIGSDPRIGSKFLFPGLGYGGSCFPKDVRTLINTAEENGITADILRAVDSVNNRQKAVLFEKADEVIGDLAGRTFAIWGLSFKPRTDDMREAPSLVLISHLLDSGCRVRVYDPVAMEEARKELGDRVEYASDQYQCVADVDGLFLVTEWGEFRAPDFTRMKELMKTPLIFDGRNQYEPSRMRDYGFEYMCIGRNNG